MDNTSINVMGDLEGVTLDDMGGPMVPGDYPSRITGVTVETSQSGWKRIKAEFAIANGKFAGRKLTTWYNWTAPTDEEGKVIPSDRSIESKMADNPKLSHSEAVELAREGTLKAQTIGRQQFKKLMNAAGFIDMADTKPGDSNLTRIEAGLAQETPEDFTPDMLVTKLVMVRTKTEANPNTGKEYQVVKSVWDVDPEKVGDLGEDIPF